ncbi:RHS repeat-associated core domain-containing protein, partial [Pantoea cypripedii]
IHDTLRGQVDYGYDAEGRLLKHYEARQGHASRWFRYDAADNLVDEEQASVAVRDNRLRQWQQLLMKYDAWGNLIRRRSGQYEQQFTYDAENRLITASGSGPQGQFTAQYHYDALGRRTRKVVNSGQAEQETRFLWQGYRLLQEQQANGNRQTYVYDPAETWSPLARIDHQQDTAQGEIFWFSTDLNGAPLEVTDAGGAVRWSGQYGSFGEVSRQTEGFYRLSGLTSLHHQPLRYAGQYADRETGLHYNLFRYYDPQVGRFTVQDPIGLAGGENLYAYAPNPFGWIDPLGLNACGPNKKTTFEGVSRRDAFRQAKRDAGIPNSQHPFEVSRARLGDGYGDFVRNKNGTPIETRQYHFKGEDGATIVIQEHSLGHVKATPLHGAEPHFNVRPIYPETNKVLDTGSVSGTHGHYNFP